MFLAQTGFDPIGAIGDWRNVALAVVGLLLILLSVFAMLKAKSGDLKKTASISAGSVIALVPIAIAVVGVMVVAGGLGGWFGVGR